MPIASPGHQILFDNIEDDVFENSSGADVSMRLRIDLLNSVFEGGGSAENVWRPWGRTFFRLDAYHRAVF